MSKNNSGISKCRWNVLGIKIICIWEKQGVVQQHLVGANVTFTVANNMFTSTAVAKVTAGSTAPSFHIWPVCSHYSLKNQHCQLKKSPEGSITVIDSEMLKHICTTTQRVFGELFSWESFRVYTLSFADYPLAAAHLQIAKRNERQYVEQRQ